MVAPIFQQRESRNLWQSAGATLMLIHNEAAHQLRAQHRNAVVALAMNIVQSLFMVAMFMGIFLLMGVRRSPLRGDYLLFVLSGMLFYKVHVRAMGAVSGATGISSILQHRPLNTAILICAGALGTIYQETLTIFIILIAYHALGNPVTIEYPLAAYGMLLLVWFYGICVGMVVLAISPWWPMGAQYIRLIYMRANMIASGKMFVANALPGMMLGLFDWNPLFHIIDQTRGFVFVNYTPHHTTWTYPVKVALVMLMIGLMGEFVTRRSQSLSWGNKAN